MLAPARQPKCPTCSEPFDPARSAAVPFCSERCRQIDLGRWLDERYGLPYEPENVDDGFGDEYDDR
ncbi:MAG: DNA gyrase inhibitor YacG [Pirellulaceae bacterium]|nr:DNA gyrase inhibitor YacG [Planctomycetales bacterium]MCA9201624.1 DNA gyrase inhibitor YacG [Planctomycetales bacterium]MCA9219807.1 DNA gyrase inhibitor YacG [Planctomycetales bacterium]MCA9227632.1 DNA gyrase inhibitor YacG [Planctomycetales bacterium]